MTQDGSGKVGSPSLLNNFEVKLMLNEWMKLIEISAISLMPGSSDYGNSKYILCRFDIAEVFEWISCVSIMIQCNLLSVWKTELRCQRHGVLTGLHQNRHRTVRQHHLCLQNWRGLVMSLGCSHLPYLIMICRCMQIFISDLIFS